MGKRYRGYQRNFLGVHPYEAGMIFGVYCWGYKRAVVSVASVVGQFTRNWWASNVLRKGRGRHRTSVLTSRITMADLMRRLDEEAVLAGRASALANPSAVMYPPSPLELSIRASLAGMNTTELAQVGIRKEVVAC